MNQEQIDKLRAAGYTDDDIRDFSTNQPSLGNAPTQTTDETLPEIDVTKPSDTIKNAEAQGIPTGARESSMLSDLATVAPVVLAENAGKIALGGLGAGALGAGALYKSGKAKELEAEKIRQAGIQKRFDAKMSAQAVPVTAPVAPSPILDANGRPMQSAGPVNPATQPQPKPASMMNRVQAAAANKIQNLPGAGMMGQAGRIAGRALPGVGTALNAADAYGRFQEGDYLGAGIAGVGAAASPFPILGTAVGMGTGAVNAYRDYLKRQEEEKKRMMQQ
jgi:hypothetical protein